MNQLESKINRLKAECLVIRTKVDWNDIHCKYHKELRIKEKQLDNIYINGGFSNHAT